jgi:hypothetical protein
MVEYADPKLRHEQAVGKLEGPGTPSHGQRHSQAVDEEGVPSTISVDRGRTKSRSGGDTSRLDGDEMSPLYEKLLCERSANHWLNVDSEERCRLVNPLAYWPR